MLGLGRWSRERVRKRRGFGVVGLGGFFLGPAMLIIRQGEDKSH